MGNGLRRFYEQYSDVLLRLTAAAMKKTSKAKQVVARRAPTQKRAQRTRMLILETAAQMLEDGGLEQFNTNRLAERSGFSVGTLYQYFADKHAILEALAQYERERRIGMIRDAMLRHDLRGSHAPIDGDEEQLARVGKVVRIILDAFDGRHRARRVLMDLALQRGRQQELNKPLAQLAAMLTTDGVSGRGSTVRKNLSETDAFVLTRAIAGALRAALAKNPRLLKQREFEAALVGLIVGFLRFRLS